MEENTSKVLVAGDANLAVAALFNPDAGAGSSPGSSLFVVNLCASMAPLANVGKSLPGLENYRLYQVSRREDGRTRYRLRLGFFTSEADAEAVLNSVRDHYPTAFTACLCDEDRKFARGFVPEHSLAAVPAPGKSPSAASAGAQERPPKPVAVAPKIAVVDTKPAVAAKPAQQPAKLVAPSKPLDLGALIGDPLESTAKHKRINPPPPAKAEPVAKAAPVAKPAPTAKAAPVAKPEPKQVAPTPVEEAVEIELSWEPPALQPSPDATPQVVAAGFKTQEVIKAPAPPAPPVAKKVVDKPAAEPLKAQAPQAAPKKDAIEAPSKLLQTIELTLENETKPAPAKPAAAAPSNEPFRVGKGVEIPKTSLTLEAEVAAKPAAPAKPAAAPTIAATAAPVKPMADVSKMKAAQDSAPVAIKAAVAPTTVRKVDGPPPDLDSTQTIRALTSDELKDDSQEKWFSIQLAVSDQPVNLDAMPRLDIFEAYRLYSVASAGSGKITHSLRLGFFREEHSAEAVNGYLKTFFNSPTVVRISIAEQSRFKDAPAPKAMAKAAEAKVLDLSHARDRAPKVVPTVTMEVEPKKFDPLATGSFKANATGTHKALATGAHNALSATGKHKSLSASGSHKALTGTGTHKMNATGTHKALKIASKAATPPTKRSQPLAATGKHKALQKKSLSEELLDEAREVELSQSGIRKIPKNDSLFSKMFGKKK